MQTNFSPDLLALTEMKRSEKILRSCVHCGFCSATCPTYLLDGNELDSPRGRIYLIKDMLESGRAPTAKDVLHIDRCLSCLSCRTTCPSGVDYMHLIDHARAHIEQTYRRPLLDRMLRSILGWLLPRPRWFRRALLAAKAGRPVSPPLGFFPGGERVRAMIDLAPRSVPRVEGSAVPPDAAGGSRRVILLQGCAQSVLQPEINVAATRLLSRHGTEVVSVAGEGCCGALPQHLGQIERSRAHARRNIDLWLQVIEEKGVEAILVTASGCGTSVKDYDTLFVDDPLYADKARTISALARDITEYLSSLRLDVLPCGELSVAYHPACSLQHGQRVTDEPKRLLEAAGFRLKSIAESHICCGSAGTYNILQPAYAKRLRDRKTGFIKATVADAVATGNIGCMTQLQSGLDQPVVHTVQLLDWAYGGPMPEALRRRFEFRPD